MIRRPPRSTQSRSSAASDVYKRQDVDRQGRQGEGGRHVPIGAGWQRDAYAARHAGASGRAVGGRRAFQIRGVRRGRPVYGRTDAIRVGVGMAPRGEVGMVVAQIGLNLGVIGHNMYGIIVFMSVATTLIAPPLLKLAFGAPTEMEREIIRLG